MSCSDSEELKHRNTHEVFIFLQFCCLRKKVCLAFCSEDLTENHLFPRHQPAPRWKRISPLAACGCLAALCRLDASAEVAAVFLK